MIEYTNLGFFDSIGHENYFFDIFTIIVNT